MTTNTSRKNTMSAARDLIPGDYLTANYSRRPIKVAEVNILEVERADRPIPRDISTLAGLYADVAAAGVTVSDVLEHRA